VASPNIEAIFLKRKALDEELKRALEGKQN
jgi:hypothetical protein